MALLFVSKVDDPQEWRAELTRRLPDLEVRVYPETGPIDEIDMALVWLPPPGLLASLPNLRLILSLGAGVDAMLADPTLPDVPLCRLVDESLTRTMSEFVLLQVLRYHRELDHFARDQRVQRWHLRIPPPTAQRRVGILGLGVLGTHAAVTLRDHGFSVRGWARSPKSIDGVRCFAGQAQLGEFLSGADLLVCLLPLTDETRGILDRDLFAQLPQGARLIQVGRGAHLVEPDLLDALASGQLAGATLDVFTTEPLPAGHPFWSDERIDITPHAASYSDPGFGAGVIVDNIVRLREGRPLQNVVDRARGY